MNNNNNRKRNGKKQWTAEELLHHFLPVYNSIFEHPRSVGFIEEVDPEELGIPDYFDIIKNPIALCTILKKLHEGTYTNPWDIVNDFWLMFNNCLLFNKKSTPIYKDCLQLIDVFVDHSSSVMKKLGFCCANLYYFEPKLKSCGTTKNCLIKNNCSYYKADSPKQEFLVCEKCYNSAGDIIELNQTNKISKNLFIQLKNDVREDEKFIQCSDCGREWHLVCALYRNDGNEFLCEGCRMESGSHEKYSSQMIPASNLSKYIENQVNSVLKNLDSTVDEIVIRDFVNKNNKLEYQTKFKERYLDFSQPLEYTSRAIYAFTKIDGIDVMFFGIHSQEYSPNTNGPNKSCVNITYLDSVSFFQPSSLKTVLYQQILMSYLDYIRRFGIMFAHLWVCPPEIGNDYIFHRHPVEQKLPKKDRLKAWYESAFRLGMGKFVLGFENIVEYNRDISVIKPTDIPYFDGDFWPTEIENLLIDIDREVQCQMNKSVKEEKFSSLVDKSRKRKRKSKGGPQGKKRKVDIENIYDEINIRFNDLLNKWGDDFIVVKLLPLKSEEFDKSEDKKEIWSCETLETRDRFLPFCKDFNLEFSTLRRIKYTTMHILYEIVRDNKKTKIFCNICHKTNMRVRYFCERCIDFDLCESCYRENPHNHEMSKEQSKEEMLTIEQCADLVYHVFNCNENDCLVFRCDRVKAVKKHIDNCVTKNCWSCKNMAAALMNHSRFCKVEKCNVYTCKNNRILKETNPNINKEVYKSPNLASCQPLLSSTPKTSQSSDNSQRFMQIIMTEISKLKRIYSDYNERNQAFSKFMKDRPELNRAYLLLKQIMRKNAECNSQNVRVAPEVSFSVLNTTNVSNQAQPGLSHFIRNDIQDKVNPTISFQNTPQMIRHPQTNQLIPVRSVFPQIQNNVIPQINNQFFFQTEDHCVTQTHSNVLPQSNNFSLPQAQNHVFHQTQNHGLSQPNNHSLPEMVNNIFPQKLNNVISQTTDNSLSLSQTQNHIYIKSEHQYPQFNLSKPRVVNNNVPNIQVWNSQQPLRKVTNILNTNTKIVIKAESGVHNVGVVRIDPRERNLIRIDPSKSTRVTSEIPMIRIIKP